MSATPSIKVLKSCAFKDGIRVWSNRYHFNGGTPADATHWHTLMDNVVTAEKATLQSYITITECVGYAAGSDVPVATKLYTTAGTLSIVGGNYDTPLETCALVRYSTAARTSKNHPIYLFNYVHGAAISSSGIHFETLDANMKSHLATYGGLWVSGFSDGTITAVRASPNGAAATGVAVEEYVTHRDFPYSPSL
jgi:hypothetical protein